MKTLSTVFLMIAALALIGCEERILEPDYTPPSPPRGLYTLTGDGEVELIWNHNPEGDLAGYNIYVSTSYYGKYTLVASAGSEHYIDRGAVNGTTYYYAVAAYDFDGNESDLSRDVAYDTPRPEGYGVIIGNFRTDPDRAGYDFSTYSVGPYDDAYADVYFEYYDGAYYLVVWEDSDIQDMGYTGSLYEIGGAPAGGWSPVKDARVIPGHTYVIWTWDNHYAKVRVKSVSQSRVEFDWAYQLQSGNTRLKSGVHDTRNPLKRGSGAIERQ